MISSRMWYIHAAVTAKTASRRRSHDCHVVRRHDLFGEEASLRPRRAEEVGLSIGQ